MKALDTDDKATLTRLMRRAGYQVPKRLLDERPAVRLTRLEIKRINEGLSSCGRVLVIKHYRNGQRHRAARILLNPRVKND